MLRWEYIKARKEYAEMMNEMLPESPSIMMVDEEGNFYFLCKVCKRSRQPSCEFCDGIKNKLYRKMHNVD